jgi:hypothetical protein
MYRNQAIVARICFEDGTWRRYWLPRVFAGHLTEEVRRLLDSTEIVRQHEDFQRRKVRGDAEFWTELVRASPPREAGLCT